MFSCAIMRCNFSRSTMNADRLKQIEGLYHAAVEQPHEKRADWLAKLCGTDIALRREVESLLARHERDDGLLGRPMWTAGAEMISVNAAVLTFGTKVGHFDIVGPLGKGTMGEVYKAFDTELKRLVAIKVLPPEF